jgi:catalase
MKERLVAAIAGNLGRVSPPDVIARSIEHFRRADPDYGARVAKAVNAVRG